MEKQKILFLNEVYRRLNVKNEDLLAKADKNPDYDINTIFKDAVILSITSHGMTLLKNILLEYESIGSYLNIRGIIEGLALLELEKSGKMKEKNIRMFAESWKVKEYIMYSKFADILPHQSMFDLETMKQNYDDFVREYFSDLNSNKIKSLCLNQNFFLYDISKELLKPYGLVKGYCNEKLYEIYQNVSIVTHPHRYGYYRSSLNEDFINNHIILELIALSETFAMNYPIHRGFIEENNAMMTGTINPRLYRSFMHQKNALLHLSNECKLVFQEDNFVSGWLDTIGGLYCDVHYNSIIGLTEDVKIKVKIILEAISTFVSVYLDPRAALTGDDYRIRLLNFQTKIELLKRYPQDDEVVKSIEQQIAKAFKIFKNENNIDKVKFGKIFSSNSMAFMIDDRGNCPTITKFVEQVIDSLYQNNDSTEIMDFKTLTKIYYRESQSIAHTSGYLYFSDDAIFSGEENNIYIILDNLILLIIQYILVIFQSHKIMEESNKYLKIIECAKKSERIFKEESQNKRDIYTNFKKVNKNTII